VLVRLLLKSAPPARDDHLTGPLCERQHSLSLGWSLCRSMACGWSTPAGRPWDAVAGFSSPISAPRCDGLDLRFLDYDERPVYGGPAYPARADGLADRKLRGSGKRSDRIEIRWPLRMGSAGSLQAFAGGNRLTFAPTASLPEEGALLSAGGTVEGAVSGALPGGLDGTLAYYTYTTSSTDSDGHTSTTHHHNSVVVAVSGEHRLCAVPRLPRALRHDRHRPRRQCEEAGGGRRRRRQRRSRVRLRRNERRLADSALLARADRLAGSQRNDFGFELSAGVLCVAREGYLEGDELTSLASDASHVAAAIDQECQEATDSGSAAAQGRTPSRRTRRSRGRLPTSSATAPGPPRCHDRRPSVATCSPRRPSTPGRCCGRLLISLGINVFLLAITINLAVAHSWTAIIVLERRAAPALLHRRVAMEGQRTRWASSIRRPSSALRALPPPAGGRPPSVRRDSR